MLDASSTKLAWSLILVSGLLEVAFALAIDRSAGFTRWLPATLALVFGSLSVYLMSLTLKVIPIGTAYAVWGGVGAVGTVAVGVLFLGESASVLRLLCIGLIVAGIVGLQMLGQR